MNYRFNQNDDVMKNIVKIYLKIKIFKISNFNKFCFFFFKICFFNNEFVDLFFEDDFGRFFGEQSVVEFYVDNSVYGFTDRVEGVYFVQGFFWYFVFDRLVFLIYVKDKVQQSIFCFVFQLLRQVFIFVRL